MKLKQKPLPDGYETDSRGSMHYLYKGKQVIAWINDYRPPKIDEKFVMSIYQNDDDWEALEVFYGNYLREQELRKQRGKSI